MQVFGKSWAFLGGIDEAIAILKECAVEWSELKVWALYDGDEVQPWETVLLIEGPYDAFAHLETLYLGVLSRALGWEPTLGGWWRPLRPKKFYSSPPGMITGWSRPETATRHT